MRNPLKRRPSADPKPSLRERLRATKARAGKVLAINCIMLTPEPKPVPAVDRVALVNYATWLHMERRLVCHELYPQLGAGADRFVLSVTGAEQFHFPSAGDWRRVPKPSTRAVRILDMVGVDWRRDLADREDFDGPAMQPSDDTIPPHGWPALDAGLVSAVSDLLRLDATIDSLHSVSGGYGPDLPEYEPLERVRRDAIATLTDTPAEGLPGLQAKARAAMTDGIIGDGVAAEGLAQSVARDLLRLPQRAIVPSPDPIFSVLEEAKRLFAAWKARLDAPNPLNLADGAKADAEADALCRVFHGFVENVLLRTVPRTGKGCAALARYCGEIHAAGEFALDEDERGQQHLRVLDLIARSPLL